MIIGNLPWPAARCAGFDSTGVAGPLATRQSRDPHPIPQTYVPNCGWSWRNAGRACAQPTFPPGSPHPNRRAEACRRCRKRNARNDWGRCAPILRAPPQRWGAGDHRPYSVRVAQCRPQGGQSAKALTSNNDGIVRYGMARRLCLPLCVFHGGTGKQSGQLIVGTQQSASLCGIGKTDAEYGTRGHVSLRNEIVQHLVQL